MSGILGSGDMNDPQTLGLLSFFMKMLEASGPQPRPTSLGQVIGASGAAGIGAYQGQQDRIAKQQMQKIQMEDMRAQAEQRKQQAEHLKQQMAAEIATNQFLTDKSNLFNVAQPQSATGDFGPGEAPTIGSQTATAKPKSPLEIAVTMMSSGNPALARMGLSQLSGLQKKELVPIGPHGLYEPSSGNIIGAPDEKKPGTPGETERLVATLNDPNVPVAIKAELQRRLRVLQTPPMNIMPVQTDAGIIPFNTKTGAPGSPFAQPPEKLKPIPTNINTAITENANAVRKVDEAIKLVDAHPDAFGVKNYLGENVNQRLDPKGVEARAAVADLGSQKIHDRSGAAVSVYEFPRLAPFVPSKTDDAATVKKKLVRFKQEYEFILNDMFDTYNKDSGYRDHPKASSKPDPLGIRK